jgi:hypothetical protein
MYISKEHFRLSLLSFFFFFIATDGWRQPTISNKGLAKQIRQGKDTKTAKLLKYHTNTQQQ